LALCHLVTLCHHHALAVVVLQVMIRAPADLGSSLSMSCDRFIIAFIINNYYL